MKQEHYPSLELCKKLTEIGFPKTQHTYSFWWDKCEEEFTIVDEDDDGVSRTEFYRCPSVMEMLDVMPRDIHVWHHQYTWSITPYWFTYVPNQSHSTDIIPFFATDMNDDTAGLSIDPNAIAEMILWLHENKYISFN